MNYKYLGKTGLKVSELCLGTMTFGRESSEQVSHKMLDQFVAAGGNFIDTADVYGRGVSEIGSTGWTLSQEHITQLNKASDIPLLYPYDFLEGISGARKHEKR